ncbi:immunoglobulin domain-containing protein [Synoicihabitans lomoniglobus]|uniref:Immunoglobulin domain-containing protein n=1 Tax=Synoicihabitans lomoniglobus TaxID=2909285 RepID=A0AAF0CPE3_9BACT|nr:immunoglobulin domain-containing protein [Opitutaceae bacterium LMO-M01]WED64294.1 immunoglobulin domain-containing protein [Opitutaceae bacterium LMO-M01]
MGTVPAVPGLDYELVWPDEDLGAATSVTSELVYVQLNPVYVEKLQAHDRLRIIAAVHRGKSLTSGGITGQRTLPATTAIAHREFILYDIETYRREVIASRVPAHDIQAFPLPEKEVEYLFGPLVRRSYYVIRLTLRNTSGTDKLVNSGLISATGRALVVPLDKSQPTFTVPVTLSPQGPVQVYTILDDQTPWRTRPWVFRGLEFIGALGAAAVTSFPNSSTDLVKGTALLTGVFVPEMKKLWPDDWAGFKKNVVTFSMPELTKIPGQSTTSPMYLFFPKRELELFVSDQALYESPVLFAVQDYLPVRTKADNAKPKVRIVSIGFDSLDVPFENTLAPAKISLAGRIASANEEVEVRIDELTRIKNRLEAASASGEAALVIGQVSKRQLVEFQEMAKKALAIVNIESATADSNVSSGDVAGGESTFVKDTELSEALEGLLVVANGLIGFYELKGELYETTLTESGNASFSLLGLEKLKIGALRDATTGVLTYSDSQSGEEMLRTIKERIEASEALVKFIAVAAKLLAENSLVAALGAIAQPAEGMEPMDQRPRSRVIGVFATLKQARSVPVLPNFDRDNYPQLRSNLNTLLGDSLTPPTIVDQPVGVTVTSGNTATFTVTAKGNPEPDYTWFRNGQQLAGEVGSVLSIRNCDLSLNGTNYQVFLSNSRGSLYSDPFILSVTQKPVISPSGLTASATSVRAGTSVSFSIEVTGSEIMSYRWFHNGKALPSESGQTLNLTDVGAAHAGNYSVQIHNVYGDALSKAVALTVVPFSK